MAGNGSYIVRPCGHDLHGPTMTTSAIDTYGDNRPPTTKSPQLQLTPSVLSKNPTSKSRSIQIPANDTNPAEPAEPESDTAYETVGNETMTKTQAQPMGQGTQMDQMMKILQNMSNKLTSIQDDIQVLKDNKTEVKEQIAGMMFDLEDDQEELIAQKKQLNMCNDKVDMLTSLLLDIVGP